MNAVFRKDFFVLIRVDEGVGLELIPADTFTSLEILEIYVLALVTCKAIGITRLIVNIELSRLHLKFLSK